MMSLKFFVSIVVLNWSFCSGSIIELNDTTLASLPALYALDEWSQCQRPGDEYCIVDADLVATQPSPLFELLQDYSKQTLKHYNRTQIHRGVCVTRCADDDVSGRMVTREQAAQLCVNRSVGVYGLEAEVTSVNYCMSADHHESPTLGSRLLAVLCVVLLALVLTATGLHAMCDKCAKFDGNKYLLAFSLKQNWAVLTYDRSRPRTDDRMKDLACIEGIRFLGMQCVIFSHVLFVYLYSFTDNPQFVERMYDQFMWQAVMNSPVWLQAFFSLSGFLTAYSVLICSEKRPFTFIKCLQAIVNRYIRITPLAAFALWFTISWFPLLGSGPQWSWLVTRESQDCSERWWYHMFYIHNHLPLGKLCMGHTWYLAVDMQLHIGGILLILLLAKARAQTAQLSALALTALSAAAAAAVVAVYGLQPIVTAQAPESLRTLFAGSKVMSLLYLPVWMNLSGYAGGVATAFALHHHQAVGVKLNQNKWFNLLFHLSFHLASAVVMTGAVFLSDSQPPLWASALYAALDRTLVALFFNIFLLGCVSRCKSAFRDMLSWRGFHTLGRLSYCAFLIHFIVLRLTLASNTQLGHATVFTLIALLVTASSLTYLISVPLVLLIELPCIALWKALTERETAIRPQSDAQTHSSSKACDLVAQTRGHV